MYFTLRTFDDVMAALRRGGGHFSGRIVLSDRRVVTLTADEVDPVIEIETREAEPQPEALVSAREGSSEEFLRLLGGVPGALG